VGGSQDGHCKFHSHIPQARLAVTVGTGTGTEASSVPASPGKWNLKLTWRPSKLWTRRSVLFKCGSSSAVLRPVAGGLNGGASESTG
jgi:hypothetical protein